MTSCTFCKNAGHITRTDSKPPIWWCDDCWIDELRQVGPVTLVPIGNVMTITTKQRSN
jgi:ribosomal protein L37AE/L43A